MVGRRYQLERELGRGASGAVYRGRDIRTGRLIALKIRNACAGGGCVVVPYARGRDLRNYVRPGNLLPLAAVLSIAAQAADALAAMHACGAIHGDLSPANIVFHRASGTVRLIDAADAPENGTLAYMSPEQVRGLAIGAASDQFSLAVVLYRLACGELPFSERSRPQFAHRVANEPHPDIRTVDPRLPAALAVLLNRALEKKPAARFPSAAVLAAAVREVAAALPPPHVSRA